MLRYFTASEPWIRGFPDVHIVNLSPLAVVRAWEAIAAAACVSVLSWTAVQTRALNASAPTAHCPPDNPSG